MTKARRSPWLPDLFDLNDRVHEVAADPLPRQDNAWPSSSRHTTTIDVETSRTT